MSNTKQSGALAAAKWYPAEDVARPRRVRKAPKPTRLRKSLTPGTVCIILAGRYRGKRVVMLKAIDDTLLVTGPFKVNGVPLRRVNARYVIATSTKIDLAPANVDLDKFCPQYFAKPTTGGKKKVSQPATAMLDDDASTPAAPRLLPAERVDDQKRVDGALLGLISGTPHLRAYLASTFCLNKGDKPHEMNF